MDFLPGYLQGITRVLISHPFDYIRIYLQMNKYKNIKEFIKHNKIKTIYRGVSIPLLIVPIDRAIGYRVYEILNKKNINPIICGGISGIISSIINLPTSYISNTYILNNKKGLINYINEIRKQENYKKLFYGYKPEIIRSISGSSIYLGIYGILRNKYGNETKQSIINSSIAGITLWTITYPLETLKIEQQMNNNKNILEILNLRIKQYGILNLWKGILPIYMRTLPSSIGGMLIYEKTRSLINNH